MIEFILNNQSIQTTAPHGTAMLDFIRKEQQLKGSKLVCKEGECGACTVLVGQLTNEGMVYQSMTSCIMPLANAHGKHIVTIEGLNMEKLSPVQNAMVENYGTQCGFCTPGFVVSLTGHLLSNNQLTRAGIIAAIDGNICRCTGYKSIERAAEQILKEINAKSRDDLESPLDWLVANQYIPNYFIEIPTRLAKMAKSGGDLKSPPDSLLLGGGTDLYVQRPYEMYEAEAMPIYDQASMNGIEISGGICTFGASLTMGDLYRSPVFQQALPDSAYIFKLLSSTQIRNMATIGGNLVNASPIGDFTILLLALDSTIVLSKGKSKRQVPLKKFYKGYKQIDLQEGEILEEIKFKIPTEFTKVHFEKVSQRKYFDIASVNFASKFEIKNNVIQEAHLAVGGVGPIPTYLQETAKFLTNQLLDESLIKKAITILNTEISPISDARGSAEYKRLLARQIFVAQFLEMDENLFDLRKYIVAK